VGALTQLSTAEAGPGGALGRLSAVMEAYLTQGQQQHMQPSEEPTHRESHASSQAFNDAVLATITQV
jgi:hypothetical protein